MQIANQQIPTMYYYPPYQTNNLISAHLNQAHTNVHIYHRIEPSMSQKHTELHKLNPQHENIKNKHNINQKQSEHYFHRSQLSKTHTYGMESPAQRQVYYDQQNIQNCSINANKNVPNMLSDSVLRNKSVFQLKRKQSSTGNSRDVRQEYYKGQQQREQLLNKLPQIELQQLNKGYVPRQNQINPSKSPNIKQLKKNASPSPFKFRSSSIKQQNSVEGLQLKKAQSSQQDQIKKIRQTISFKSVQNTRRDQQNDIINFKSGPNTDRNHGSVCSTTYGNSNTTSICLDQSPKIQPLKIGTHAKNSYQTFTKKQSGKEVQCQTNLIEVEANIQITKLKENVKILENQVEELKIMCHQKDMKLRQIQHEMNLQKIASQKKILITQRELSTKKQAQISLLKQQHEKQISKIVSELKQKFSVEQKQTEFRFQNALNQIMRQNEEIKIQYQNYQVEKNQLFANVQNQQKIIIGNQHRIRDLQRIKSIYQEKNIQLQEHCEKQNQKIQSLLSSQIPSNSEPASHKQDKSTSVNIKSLNQDEQSQKIKQLEQKILQYLSNMDKQSQILKQSKSQADKYKRRSQQFNFVIIDKESLIKSLYKDLKAIEKQLMDSKKGNEKLGDMLDQQNYQVGKLNARLLNLKYTNLEQPL